MEPHDSKWFHFKTGQRHTPQHTYANPDRKTYDNDIEQVNIGGDSAEPNHAMYHI